MNRVPTKWQDIVKMAIAFVVMWWCFVWTVNFLVAERPPGRYGGMPASWSAGVMNHGNYYEWHTIADRPLWFIASALGLALSAVTLIRIFRKANSD